MKFSPEEALFFPTAECNMICPHCQGIPPSKELPERVILDFISDCAKNGIVRAGFSGGEPFLAIDRLISMVKRCVRENMGFGRIMTNAVWYKRRRDLEGALTRLHGAGYDGSICVSIDAFHGERHRKAAGFIKTARDIWDRADIVSLACVSGARRRQTERNIGRVAACLGAEFSGLGSRHPYIRSKSIFIRISKIELSSIGRASALKDPWDGRWFEEDHCAGPGNVLCVVPDGKVKPCCGYAQHLEDLTIGRVGAGTLRKILLGAEKNRFVYTVFNSGLSSIRKRLAKRGHSFPGKTTNHCYFCHYLLTEVDRGLLNACLD